jgi:hypothetical protein
MRLSLARSSQPEVSVGRLNIKARGPSIIRPDKGRERRTCSGSFPPQAHSVSNGPASFRRPAGGVGYPASERFAAHIHLRDSRSG